MKSLLLQANALSIPLASESVQCVVTSPPYWSLRDYGVAGQLGLEALHDCAGWATGDNCGACFVCHMRAVFAEVRRVLRDDGTCWLNLGDSYAGSWGNYAPGGIKGEQRKRTEEGERWERQAYEDTTRKPATANRIPGLKPKDLVGIPWRVALALQADGWYLRSDCIWAKPNPMPESVTDRPTKAHEYMFLLAKSERYYYDADAVTERCETEPQTRNRNQEGYNPALGSNRDRFSPGARTYGLNGRRNRRTVWTIATAPYSGAHFATYPPALVEPCIKAGTSERGACPKCGKPWERVVEKGYRAPAEEEVIAAMIAKGVPRQKANLYGSPSRDPKLYAANPDRFMGWSPACTCDAGEPVPCVVLDPFSGAGTTGMVAEQLGRRYIGLDLSAEYLALAQDRIGLNAWDEWTNGKQAQPADLGPLFGGLS